MIGPLSWHGRISKNNISEMLNSKFSPSSMLIKSRQFSGRAVVLWVKRISDEVLNLEKLVIKHPVNFSFAL